ncbi:MAG: hypothetical protein NTV80_11470 [Verrucomicrobia bacterium]|nr:hypothetical protein [Verrucomicrobiota bacterium]
MRTIPLDGTDEQATVGVTWYDVVAAAEIAGKCGGGMVASLSNLLERDKSGAAPQA